MGAPDPSRSRRAPGDWPYSELVRELHQLLAHDDGIQGALKEDFPALAAHPAVATRLPATGAGPRQFVRALEGAIEDALASLRDDNAKQALRWHFALADDSSLSLASDRRARAAEIIGYSLSQYAKERADESGNWKPSKLSRTLRRVEQLLDAMIDDEPAAEPARVVDPTDTPEPHADRRQLLQGVSAPTVLFACALPSAREHAEIASRCCQLVPRETLGAAYLEGVLELPDAVWRVVLLATGRGNTNSQSKTLAVLTVFFDAACAFFLGCAGGFKHKGIERGDLIVPRTVHKYQSAAAPAGEKLARPDPAMADKTLVNRIELLQSRGWFSGTWHKTRPTIHFEDIVSGDVNVKSTQSSEFKFITTHYGQAVAVEMEGYGFLSAAQSARVPAVLIRGASDQIDNKTERSDKTWQPWATAAAADLAIAVLTHGDFSARREPAANHHGSLDLAPDVFYRNCSADKGWSLRNEAEVLGVKRCIADIPGPQEGLSLYIERSIDRGLRDAISSALNANRGLHTVLVDGPSFSGKTRAVIEALDPLKRECALVSPADVDALESWITVDAATALGQRAVVLLLDELESFVPSRRFGSWFDRLDEIAGRESHPLVLLATCGGSGAVPLDAALAARTVRSTRHISAIRRAAGHDEESSVVRIDHSGFEAPSVLAEIASSYDDGHGTEWADFARSGNFLRALWAGPWLEERYRHGSADGTPQIHARGQAMAWGSMLLRRIGCGDWPAPRTLLEALHYQRLGGGTLGSDASAEEIEVALDWATQEGPDGLACLVQTRRSPTSGHGYVSPAFLAERLLDETELPRTQRDADHLLALLEAHGASEQLRTKVGERMFTDIAQNEGADSDADTAPTRRQVFGRDGGGTKGSGQPADGPLPVPRGVDLAFDDPALKARLRAVEGLVVVQLKAEPGGKYDRGLVLVVASSEEANAPQHLLSSTVRVDRSPGPAWKIETGLPAPQNEAEWLQLADLVAVLPLTPRS